MSFWIVFMVSIIGIYTTYWVSVHAKQGTVRSSAGLSLLVAIVVYNVPFGLDEIYREQIPVVFFGASFMGMVSKEVMFPRYMFLLSSLIFAFVFTNLQDNFMGYGGGLGMQACISIIAVLGIDYIWLMIYQYFWKK